MKKKIGINLKKKIDELVKYYVDEQSLFARALINLEGYINASVKLKSLIHSVKSRTKNPEHLRDKLMRKAKIYLEAGTIFDVSKDNLFTKINDLAGFRILHLHTTQFKEIDLELKKIFKEEAWTIVEGPTARTWDDESKEYFNSIGVQTISNPNLYTSVHYVIKPNSRITCELQVRTLMEEVWGEVDHSLNYPHKIDNVPCREQLKVLARATSTSSRLVDSIFTSYEDYIKKKAIEVKQKKKPKKSPQNTKH